MMLKQLGNNVYLGRGYTYNTSFNLVFNQDQTIIKLTNKEKEVFKCLIANLNETVSYQHIKQYVWDDDCISIDCLRNIVNRIRQKTFYNIIRNHSGIGYSIKKVENNN